MTQKQKNIKMHMLYCLMQLLLECLDELKVTNPRMIELKNNMSKRDKMSANSTQKANELTLNQRSNNIIKFIEEKI
mgnify:CR=1 FL=1